jgi:hypothetical protein
MPGLSAPWLVNPGVRRSKVMLKRAAWSPRQGLEQGDRAPYDDEQRIDLQVAVFAITVTISVMALIFYVNWP